MKTFAYIHNWFLKCDLNHFTLPIFHKAPAGKLIWSTQHHVSCMNNFSTPSQNFLMMLRFLVLSFLHIKVENNNFDIQT